MSNSSIWCSPVGDKKEHKLAGNTQMHNNNIYCMKGEKIEHVQTGVGPGIKHIFQHGIVIHVKPVSYVS